MKKGLLLVFVLFAGFLAAGRASGDMDAGDFAKLCGNGTPDEVEAAVADGADVNGGYRDERPLVAASENPDPDVMSVLLDNGAEVTPDVLVEIAGKENASRLFPLLLENGGDINGRGSSWGLIMTPLLSAARRSDPDREFISYLLENGADINATLEYDPDYEGSDGPDERSESGNTALVYAAWADEPDPEFISFLLENGADPNKGSPTPLMTLLSNRYYDSPWAAKSPVDVNLELVALLLENGADANAKARRGQTTLMYAADNSADAVRLLLENGADINAADENGTTVLMSVIEGYYSSGDPTEMVRLLLENGAGVNAKDNEGQTALMFAAKGREYDSSSDTAGAFYPEIISLLLEKGAEVNARDNEGRTALMFAAEGHLEQDSEENVADPKTVSILLENGADTQLQDAGDDKALDYAAANLKNTDIYKRLAAANPAAGKKSGGKSGSGQSSSLQKINPSAAQLKLMSVFISNFSELGFTDFDTMDLVNENPLVGLVYFGIWHNYVNNYKSRIARCNVKNCQWGGHTIDGKHVAESLKKYFDVDFTPGSLENTEYRFYYDGKLYHFDGADGDATHYAVVKDVYKYEDILLMTGFLYDVGAMTSAKSKNPANYQRATFEAAVKPHKFNGKDTWSMLSMRSEW
jgi:ankyrin repeat protein